MVGWAIEDHLRTDLVESALRQAVTLRGEMPAKVIFHADRGTQGGFNRSSQHLDHGGVRWHVDSKQRIGLFGRRGGRQVVRSRPGMWSASSGV